MPAPNFALEGRIKQAAADAGALESALDDFVLDYHAYRFTSEAELPKWIEQCRTEKPHRFAIAGSDEQQLAIDAFGPAPNFTKRAELVRKVGEARAAEIAASFGVTLGSTKGGTIPAHIKTDNKDSGKVDNPWSSHPDNLDKFGKYNATAIGKQARLVRAIGEAKAAGIAKAVGSKLGDVRPRAA